jgi:hypothetical protein
MDNNWINEESVLMLKVFLCAILILLEKTSEAKQVTNKSKVP